MQNANRRPPSPALAAPNIVTDQNQASMIPFDYVVTGTIAAANGQIVLPLTMNQESVFELHHIMGSCSADAATDLHPNNFSVLFKDTSTGKEFMNLAVPQNILCGPSNMSIREYRAVRFSPSTTLEFTVNDLSGGAANMITLVLRGYKLFNRGR